MGNTECEHQALKPGGSMTRRTPLIESARSALLLGALALALVAGGCSAGGRSSAPTSGDDAKGEDSGQKLVPLRGPAIDDSSDSTAFVIGSQV
jgi:hypothetical protein